jgi:hypothetical protein
MLKPLHAICIAILMYGSISDLNSQCNVTSLDGFTVSIEVDQIALLKATVNPDSCLLGYQYMIAFNYTTTVSDTLQPLGLFDLQLNFMCGDSSLGQSLSLLPGQDSAITVAQYRFENDCDIATISTLGCLNYEIILNGPGFLNVSQICSIAILPVILTNFDGQYQKDRNIVNLNWSTASEQNSSHFEILRSIDGTNFNEIGRLNSHEDSQIKNSYEYTDNHFNDAILYYYQLKMVDVDNTYEMSKIISIQTSNQDLSQVMVSPNPGKNGIFNVFIPTNLITNSGIIEVYNQNMQFILGQTNSNTRVDLSNFANGIYILKVGGSITKLLKLD